MVEGLKVERLKMGTRIRNEAPMNNSNCSTSQQLNTSTSDGDAIRKEYLFPFEKLEVWQLAKKLCISVYGISKKFPSNEQYGLTSQINRAAISVASNLAEGSSRTSQKDQAHFSQLAYSSLMEVACQLSIAQELGFVDEEKYAEIRREIEGLSRKINALHRSQKKRATAAKGKMVEGLRMVEAKVERVEKVEELKVEGLRR